MSLYKHVASKGALLDGMIDLVFSEIGLPPRGADERDGTGHRALHFGHGRPTAVQWT